MTKPITSLALAELKQGVSLAQSDISRCLGTEVSKHEIDE
jgi:hypothetical protein